MPIVTFVARGVLGSPDNHNQVNTAYCIYINIKSDDHHEGLQVAQVFIGHCIIYMDGVKCDVAPSYKINNEQNILNIYLISFTWRAVDINTIYRVYWSIAPGD